MKLEWKLSEPGWTLLSPVGIPVAQVRWSEEWACYVDEKDRKLSATFEGAKEAVEKRMSEKGKK